MAPIGFPEAISRGVRDGLTGAKAELNDEQIQAAMEKFLAALQAKQEERAKEVSEKNKIEGAAFLAANARKQGVKTTATGLQYKLPGAGARRAAEEDRCRQGALSRHLRRRQRFRQQRRGRRPAGWRRSGHCGLDRGNAAVDASGRPAKWPLSSCRWLMATTATRRFLLVRC